MKFSNLYLSVCLVIDSQVLVFIYSLTHTYHYKLAKKITYNTSGQKTDFTTATHMAHRKRLLYVFSTKCEMKNLNELKTFLLPPGLTTTPKNICLNASSSLTPRKLSQQALLSRFSRRHTRTIRTRLLSFSLFFVFRWCIRFFATFKWLLFDYFFAHSCWWGHKRTGRRNFVILLQMSLLQLCRLRTKKFVTICFLSLQVFLFVFSKISFIHFMCFVNSSRW